jgi:hypothetical protein
VAEVKTYHVNVDRDGQFWRIYVPEVERSTQARNLREAETMARDLIAIMDEIPADSFKLDVDVELPEDIRHELEQSAVLREQAAHAQAEAARLARQAAQHMHEQMGLSLRDIGRTLGVTFQRAKQLVDEGQVPDEDGWIARPTLKRSHRGTT